jgi:hypothetical protein
LDSYNHRTFDWVQFPEGRARFSGGVRGIMDEQRHETFAVEIRGEEYFGEIRKAFLPNGNDYNVEVVSFGYGSDGYVGMPPTACQTFTKAEISTIQTLIVQLIAAGRQFAYRPHLLTEYPHAHFMGEVMFGEDWVLAADDASRHE